MAWIFEQPARLIVPRSYAERHLTGQVQAEDRFDLIVYPDEWTPEQVTRLVEAAQLKTGSKP